MSDKGRPAGSHYIVKLIIVLQLLIVLFFAFYVALNINRDSEPLESSSSGPIVSEPLESSSSRPNVSESPESSSSGPIVSEPLESSSSRPNVSESLASSSSRPIVPKQRGVCKSPECITLAQQLHNWRDVSVDPCQDFYKAVCGKYNEHALANSKKSKQMFIIEQLLREFLSKMESSTSKSENDMRIFYGQCEQEKRLKKDVIKLIRDDYLLKVIRKIGSFPILDKNWKEEDFDLNEILSRRAEFTGKTFGFFALKMNYDPLELLIRPEGFITAKDFDYMEEMLVAWQGDIGMKSDEQQMKEDIKHLKELSVEFEKFDVKPQGFASLSDLQKDVPSLDFEKILKSVFKPNRQKEAWKRMQEKLKVVNHPLFFNSTMNLATIIQNTPNRTLANYLFIDTWINIESSIPEEKGAPDCVLKVLNHLPLAALRWFTRNHFDKENLKTASDLVEEIKTSFMDMIRESTWLSGDTKKAALRKLEKMKKMIGYPEELEAPGALDSYFDSLSLSDKDSFFAMNIEVSRFVAEQQISFALSMFPLDPNKIYAQVNALYLQYDNSFAMTVPILRDPFFDSSYPAYARIASIGEIIGHEMGHGFDPKGRKRDENGRLKEWWAPEESEEYEKRAKCLVDQYNSYYSDDPAHMDGFTKLTEMAADLMGITVSWRAYNKVDFPNEPSIFGFEDEQPDKLFFHLSALYFCKSREEKSFKHPEHIFRVNGVFSNMKEFAEAFNCPLGSPMNPKEKCELF